MTYLQCRRRMAAERTRRRHFRTWDWRDERRLVRFSKQPPPARLNRDAGLPDLAV